MDGTTSLTKKYNCTKHFSSNSTPIQESLEKVEKNVHTIISEKSKKIKPNYELGSLIRTADKKFFFSKGDTTNWSHKFYYVTEIISDTIPNYPSNNSPDRRKLY